MGTLIKLWFHLPEGTAGGSIAYSWTKTQRAHTPRAGGRAGGSPGGVDDGRRGIGAKC